MIKILSKFSLLVFVFIFFFILFFPMKNLYFYGEKELLKQKVVLNDEKFSKGIFSFSIKDSQFYYNNILTGDIKNIDFKYFVLYNKLHIQNIKLKDKFQKILPLKISFIDIEYSVLDILNVNIKSSGEFGKATGKVDILKKEINIVLIPSNKLKSKYSSILSKMKKTKGVYNYVYKY